MNKKITIITIGVILLGIVIYLIIANTNSPIDKAIDKAVDKAKVEEKTGEPANKEEKEPSEEKKDKTEDNVTEKVKDLVTDAVQETIGFFSNNDALVVAIGDSLTKGIGDETGNRGYVGMLKDALNSKGTHVEFKSYGKRGRRSDQLLEYLDDPKNEPKVAASISDADIVLITVGANDIMRVLKENITNITVDDFQDARVKYRERLKKVFEKIYTLNPHTDVYLLGFYNPFTRYFPSIKELGVIIRNWNEVGKEVTAQYNNATYIPTIDLFDDPNVDLFWRDNFHPNYKGYHRIAKRVLEYLHEEEENSDKDGKAEAPVK